MAKAYFGLRAQAPFRQLRGAKLRYWALIFALPFLGVVTAFGFAPDTVTETVIRKPVIEEIVLPPAMAAGSASEQAQLRGQTYWREERIQRGDTLPSLLSRLHVDDNDVLTFLNTSREARPLYLLYPGHSLRVETAGDGKLLTLHYLQGERLLKVMRDGDSFQVSDSLPELETRVISVGGVIRSSFFAATDALDIPDAIAMQLVELFSTDIDFHKDLRRDDSFTAVFEVMHDHGEIVRAGRLLAAEFINQGVALDAIWFEPRTGEGAYYTLEGKNVRKTFLRSPLEFSRISSAFTAARYHPMLRSWRAHTGVDYVAPMGARIKATADGIVDFAGVQPGYGNVVILRHQKGYTTLYAHMQMFAPGVSNGARVQQGDVIGAVGMTGLTTGPHVHYELRVNGVHQDPLSLSIPHASPLASELKPKFQQATAPAVHIFGLLRGTSPSTRFE